MDRASEIASEFVRLKVNVILASGAMVIAAKRATSVIPIVFAAAGDPVANGYIASLSHPGGNLTGLSLQQTVIVPGSKERPHVLYIWFITIAAGFAAVIGAVKATNRGRAGRAARSRIPSRVPALRLGPRGGMSWPVA
jgi:hypothetical protein